MVERLSLSKFWWFAAILLFGGTALACFQSTAVFAALVASGFAMAASLILLVGIPEPKPVFESGLLRDVLSGVHPKRPARVTAHQAEIFDLLDRISDSLEEERREEQELRETVEQLSRDLDQARAGNASQLSPLRQLVRDALQSFLPLADLAENALTEQAQRLLESLKPSSVRTSLTLSTHSESLLASLDESNQRTKLLALNAAILSAQAGESGKGFAVIAGQLEDLARDAQRALRQLEEALSLQARATEAPSGVDRDQGVLAAESLLDIARKQDAWRNAVQAARKRLEEAKLS